jgi:ABC-type glutathione transport system ATPase component
LEISLLLAPGAAVLLLAEPSAGMNRGEKDELMGLVRRLRDEFDLKILVIEHDTKLVMGVCETIVVVEHGVTIARGRPEEVRRGNRTRLGPRPVSGASARRRSAHCKDHRPQQDDAAQRQRDEEHHGDPAAELGSPEEEKGAVNCAREQRARGRSERQPETGARPAQDLTVAPE